MSNVLEVRNVAKTYVRRLGSPAVNVLEHVEIDIQAGDKVAILGKSGAGKSTLLHILGTLELPSRGSIHFEGADLLRLSESQLSQFRNRTLGFVFQFHYLMLEFSALENVMMPGLIAGMDRSDLKKRAKQLLEMVDLGHRISHKPGELSGGEQQRVAIARALVMHPKLLLTDEMTGNLDPATGAKVFELVQQLHAQFQTALVSVTHDEALAQTYPKVFRLDAGRLVRVQ